MLPKRCLVAIFGTFDLLVLTLCVIGFTAISNKRTVFRIDTITAEDPREMAHDTRKQIQLTNSSVISVSSNSSMTEHTIKLDLSSTNLKPCTWKIKECRRRLPQAIVVGVKKCGTGTLRYFLKVHPQVAFSPEEEIHYFNVPSRYSRGTEWYRRQMAWSRPGQLTIEKTPRYFVSSVAPGGIFHQISPTTKIIILLRDPVKRAVSDYLAMLNTDGLSEPKNVNITNSQVPPYVDPIYDIKPVFERSVLDDDGTIKEWNGLVNIGMYSNHIQRWLDVFPRDQLLVLDSYTLTKNPLRALKEVESFLGLTSFFRRGHFHFSPKKGFYCLSLSPGKVSCQGSAKGRKHPTVDPGVLDKLYNFYRPYDQRLVEILHQNFSWIENQLRPEI